ncbi:MAG: alkaline phosphatase [Draconibacterium sp.]
MFRKLLLMFALANIIYTTSAQDAYLNAQAEDKEKTYAGGEAYTVKTYPQKFKSKKPKNVIFMIGDGMGVAHIFAGLTANHGKLFLNNFKHIGFSETQSASDYITDSAAGGTALACGVRTYNGGLGVNKDTIAVKSVLENAEDKGLATGLVSTSAITHATPASFIAHQPSRSMYENIATDFLKTDIDVFIGGGLNHFAKRKDGRNLLDDLKKKDYRVETEMDKIATVKSGKLAGLTAEIHTKRLAERGDMLPVATETAVNILSNNKKGFFLMVEGSQIDWGGHANSTVYIVEDMLDFDRAIGKALDFASKNKETLIVVTADHETGGLAITGGDMTSGMIKGGYPTKSHSAVMVPVFAYGPGAENFTGIMKNTDVHDRIKKLLLNE